MGDLEVTVEEHLMDIFSMPGLKDRISNSGLREEEYKQGLIDSLKRGEISRGKTAQETISDYEEHIKWLNFCEKFLNQVNRFVWGGVGIMVTTPINYVLSSPILYQLGKNDVVLEKQICTFAALSLSEFIIEKRIGQGIGHYLERWQGNEKKGMKKRDYLELFSGYILKEFSFTRKKGQKIIDFYTEKNPEKGKMEAERERFDYSTLLKEREKKELVPYPVS